MLPSTDTLVRDNDKSITLPHYTLLMIMYRVAKSVKIFGKAKQESSFQHSQACLDN